MPILLKIVQKKTEEEILSYSFNKASLILKEKPEKDNIRKENYRPVSLMSTNAKFPNKILVHQIQQQIKRIINQDQVGIIPRRQGWFNICKSMWYIKLIKWEKKNHVHSSRCRKSILQNSTFISDKNLTNQA